MYGPKSNIVKLSVNNPEGKAHKVLIQLDKNNAICDIILPNRPKYPVKPEVFNQLATELYKEEKAQYRKDLFNFKNKRSRVLNHVRGRQLPFAIEMLEDVLYWELNCAE